jgi:hypothetical protein
MASLIFISCLLAATLVLVHLIRFRKARRTIEMPPTTETVKCQHLKVQPTFDREASEGLSAEEVRKRWPRFMGVCPDCGEHWILYASMEHYLAGDW